MKAAIISIFCMVIPFAAWAQELLPPAPQWNGKSLGLIAKKSDAWITPAEASGFQTTPDYLTTMRWLRKMDQQSDLVTMVSIGKSLQGRDINMVVVSADREFSPERISRSVKPLLLIQAGIHAGEIDGKDAGMMLLRDMVFGSKKKLLAGVNILFIPILNVDGHERSSPFNRVNQRGPQNMGWRTNARNYNLNRDYSKLDTEEVRAVIGVIDDYHPDLYVDVHVTDGADYQYDITYGFSESYSPEIAAWLRTRLRPAADSALKRYGHIPGPLIFAENDLDFTDGMTEFPYSPRLSNGYGDARHLPAILVENHSLKPFRQRVLGTYVFLESVIALLEKEGATLHSAIESDRHSRKKELVLSWKRSPNVDTVDFLGIESERRKSDITGTEYVVWNAKPVTQRIPLFRLNSPDKITKRPTAFWVPSTYPEIIQRLRLHGIEMEVADSVVEVEAHFFQIRNHRFDSRPMEGHITVQADHHLVKGKERFYPGSVRISTDQPLGNLAVLLLHPDSPDSFFQWGFFPEIFSRTEYIEQYVMEPLARRMLQGDPRLRREFEDRKRSDSAFVESPAAVYNWFYQKSPYFDRKWLIYPVAVEWRE